MGTYLVCITKALKIKRVHSGNILVNLIVIFDRGGLGTKIGSVSQKAMEIYRKGCSDVFANISESPHLIAPKLVSFDAKIDGLGAHAKSVVVSQIVTALH